MPAQPIDSIINEPAIQAQITRVEASAGALADTIAQLFKASESITGSNVYANVNKSITETQKLLPQLAAAQERQVQNERALTQTIIEREKARRLQVQTDNEVIKQITLEDKANQQSIKTKKEQLSYETALAREKKNGASQAASEAKIASQLSDEYFKLNKTLRDATTQYANLYLTLGSGNEKTIEAGNTVKQYTKILTDLDNSIGNYKRNVGNYASGFKDFDLSVSRILQEAPSSVNSINTFFLAISNNLPALFDDIAKAKTELLALKEATAAAQLQQSLGKGANDAAAAASKEAETALSEQVSGVIDSISASKEQAIALKEQVGEMIASGTATVEQAEATAVSTEELLLNAGANTEDAASIRQTIVANAQLAATSRGTATALEQQTAATSAATAAQRSAPSIFARLGSALLSYNTLLIAGIFILTKYGGATVDYIGNLFNAKDATDDLKEAQSAYNEVVTEGNKKAGEQIANAKVLYDATQNLAFSIEFRTQAAEKLQELFPAYFGNIEKENILNGQAAGQYDALTESIVKAARATAAKSKLDDIERQKLDIDFQTQKIRAATDREIANAPGSDAQRLVLKPGTSNQYELGESQRQYNQRVILQRRLAALDEQDKKTAKLNQQEQYLIAQIGQEDITKAVEGETDKRNSSSLGKINDYIQRLLKAQQAGNEMYIQEEIRTLQLIADNEAFGANARVIAERKLQEEKIKLIKENAELEKQVSLAMQAEVIKSIQESNKKTLDDKKLSEKEKQDFILESGKSESDAIKAFTQERSNIQLKADFDIIHAQEETSAAIIKIKSDEKKRLDSLVPAFPSSAPQQPQQTDILGGAAALVEQTSKAYAQSADIRAADFAEQQAQLEKQYRSGEISYGRYQDNLRKITVDNQRESLNEQIQGLQKQLDIYESLGIVGAAAGAKVRKALADAQKQLADLPTTAETATDKLAKVFDKIAGYIRNATDLIGQAVSNSTTKQRNALQEIEDQQEISYQNEVTRIQDSTLNEEQKQTRLLELDAERTAQKEENARKERAIARQQAVFEKAAALANITIQTAQAVIAALRPPPIGLGPIAGIPLAIATGAIGAAQFALTAAAPIPGFQHGTENAPEGVARVSEGNRAEMVIEPDGKAWMTPKHESYVYLKGGSRVIPAHEVDAMLWRYNMSAPPQYGQGTSTQIDMSRSERLLGKIAGKKSTTVVHVHLGNDAYHRYIKG